MSLIPVVKRRLHNTLWGCLACCAFNAQADIKAQNPTESLLYGQALYAFYQERQLEALTLLAIDKQRDGKAAGLNALLLETVLKLDYDMALSAVNLMEQQAVNEQLKKTDALWLYLADIFYNKRLYDIAARSLARINRPQKLADYPQWLYLKAQLAIKNNMPEQAQEQLAELQDFPTEYAYIAYNLAIDTFTQKQHDAALEYINTALKKLHQTETPEQRQLHDHLLLSAAYISLDRDNNDAAADYFGKLEKDSLFLDRALLGFARANAEKQQYRTAEQLWQRLRQRSGVNHYRLKAILALAEWYEEQEQYTDALAAYQDAGRLAMERQQQLQALPAQYSPATLTNTLQRFSDRHNLLVKSPFLVDFVSNNRIQARLKKLADLDTMQTRLEAWQEQMPVIEQIAESRVAVFRQKAAELAEKQQQYRAGELETAYQQLLRQYQRIAADKKVMALNSAAENRQLAMIENARQLLPHLTDDPFYPEYRQSVRRLEGVFVWQAWERYHQRLWQVKKQLLGFESALETNHKLQNELSRLIADKQYLAQYSDKLQRQKQNLNAYQNRINTLRQKAQQQLKTDFDNVILDEQQRNHSYLKQATLAVARVSEHFLDEAL